MPAAAAAASATADRRPAAVRDRLRRWARAGAAALLLLTALPAAAVAAGGAPPAEGEKKKDDGPRRDQAGSLSGEFILLDPVFIPIVDEDRGRTAYSGIAVRLQPNPDRRVDACFAVPRIVDALIVAFYEDRATRKEQTAKGMGPLLRRVEALVKEVAGPGVFNGVSLFEQLPEIDETSIKLSRACK